MPLVIMALAPGFAGRETLQLAVDNARLMLPYLAFAGPVTVMMALLNAQGRFALTAFSPLLFNIALIAVMAVLLMLRQDAVHAAQIIAATVGIAGLLQLSDAGAAPRRRHRNAVADFVRQGNPRLSRQGRPRHDRERARRNC